MSPCVGVSQDIHSGLPNRFHAVTIDFVQQGVRREAGDHCQFGRGWHSLSKERPCIGQAKGINWGFPFYLAVCAFFAAIAFSKLAINPDACSNVSFAGWSILRLDLRRSTSMGPVRPTCGRSPESFVNCS